MRHTILSAIASLVIAIALPSTAPAAADTTGPSYVSGSVSPSSAQVGDSVTVNWSFTDDADCCGLNRIILVPQGQTIWDAPAYYDNPTLISGTRTSGTYSKSFTVGDISSGTYEITLQFADTAGNYGPLTTIGTLEVTGQTVADVANPVVYSTGATVSPTGPDPGDTVTATWRVTDDKECCDFHRLRLIPRGADVSGGHDPVTIASSNNITRTSGDATDGTYSASLTVPSVAADGIYDLMVQVTDMAGKYSTVVTIGSITVDGVAVSTSVATDDAENTPDPVTPPSSGGGGGGGGGFFPIEETPAATPLTSNPIPVGKKVGAVDADGKAIDVIPLLAEDKKSLELSFGSAKLNLSSSSAASFSEDGKLAIAPKTPLKISASGYQPDSTITSYLVPTSSFVASAFKIASEETIELGEATANQDGSFDFEQTIDAPAGSYLLQLSGTDKDGNALTIALETLVTGDQTMKTWAKRLPGNTEAKLYAKNIVGAGKVVFKVNGKELAWVRAVDATDPKLRVITEGPMTGANYLVRTVKLLPDTKNILEVYIDGERTTRVAYSRK